MHRFQRRLAALLALAFLALPVFAATPGSADARFDALSQRYLAEFGRYSPVSATSLGDHRFDGDLDDMSADGRARRVAWVRGVLA